MIDEATIDSDERGYMLNLGGDFTDEAFRYLRRSDGVLCLRLSQDAALQLLAQTRKEIAPWADAYASERAAYDRASPAERAAVLGLVPEPDPGRPDQELLLEAGDLERKRRREKGAA